MGMDGLKILKNRNSPLSGVEMCGVNKPHFDSAQCS